ncbi:alpha/beta fold hydrolase [Acetobacter nitrogenifigens]|uniref:alpha/beta fold hydrolase n=1 Tax=Acetobacter nitrogenifigens TaxID=285268 RepID=UPI001B7F9DB0|nr:alpha/beta hydrolase [Acetobacter nitrogenifigens]
MSILDAGKCPLVLLCHGFPATKRVWRRQIEALAQAGYRAVAPDMRGYGETEAPPRPDQYTVLHAVGDLIALLDALGERQAVLVGHDWGATIAWQAALTRPDRFRPVVALTVPMMGLPPAPLRRYSPRTTKPCSTPYIFSSRAAPKSSSVGMSG